jgi:hypothetical protein
LGRQKIINPLGQKPAFGWFLSCVGIILGINDICNNIVCRMDDDLIGLGIRVSWYRYINIK